MSKDPGSIQAIILQLAMLIVGVVLVFTSDKWSNPKPVIASGIFFINIFWMTIILTYDFAIWSFLRNTVAGGIFMVSIILINFVLIAVFAIMGLFK